MNISSCKICRFIKKSNKKVLVLLGISILFLILSLYLFIIFIKEKTSVVKDVRVANVTDTSATITWITEDATKGSIIYSDSDKWFPIINSIGKKRAYDDRDIEEIEYGKYELEKWNEDYIHHVTIRNLKPEMKYYFRISTGFKTVDEKTYYPSFETGPVIEDLRSPDPVYGLVRIEDPMNIIESPDVLIYFMVYYENSQTGITEESAFYSTISVNGNYSFDMSNVRSSLLDKLFVEQNSGKIYSENIEAYASGYERGYLQIDSDYDQPAETLLLIMSNNETSKLKDNIFGEVYAEETSNVSCNHANDTGKKLAEYEECCACHKKKKVVKCEGKDGYEQFHWSKCNIDTDECSDMCPSEPGKDCANGKCGSPGQQLNYCESKYCEGSNLVCKEKYCDSDGCIQFKSGRYDTCTNGCEGGKCKDGDVSGGSGGTCANESAAPNQYRCQGSKCGRFDAECKWKEVAWKDVPAGECNSCRSSGGGGKPPIGQEDIIIVMGDIEVGKLCTTSGLISKFGTNWDYSPPSAANADETFNVGAQIGIKKSDAEDYMCTCVIAGQNGTEVTKVQWACENLGIARETCEYGRLTSDISKYPNLNLISDNCKSLPACQFDGICRGELLANASVQMCLSDHNPIYDIMSCCKPGDVTDGNNCLSGCSRDALKASTTLDSCYETAQFNISPEKDLYENGESAVVSENGCSNDFEKWNCVCKDNIWGCVNAEAGVSETQCPSGYNLREKNGTRYCVGEAEKGQGDDSNKCVRLRLKWVSVMGRYDWKGIAGDNLEKVECLNGTCRNDGDLGVKCEESTTAGECICDSNSQNWTNDAARIGNELKCNNLIVKEGFSFNCAGSSNEDPSQNIWYITEIGDDTEIGVNQDYEQLEQEAKSKDPCPKNNTDVKIGPITMTCVKYETQLRNKEGKCQVYCNEISRTEAGPCDPPDDFNTSFWLSIVHDGDCISASSSIDKNFNKFNILKEVNAEVNSEELKVNRSGIYEIQGATLTSGGNEITIYVNEEDEELSLKFFNDTNKNGSKDEGEDFIDTGGISLNKKQDLVVYDFKLGWNLVSFPIVSDEISTAKALIDRINNSDGYATHVASYRNGKWVLYTQRQDISFSEDFNILPGVGYFVKVNKEASIIIKGNRLAESLPIDLEIGWNLVGIISPDKDYTAGSLIDGIVVGGIGADTVTKWDSGMYENYIKEGGLSYGQDYKIFEVGGYFIRVKEKGGNFQP